MENASKALIIAGAILLSILIIALGIYVFNMSKNATNTDQLEELEISEFNSPFMDYEGRVMGSNVVALLDKVIGNMKTNSDSDDRLPDVVYCDTRTGSSKIVAGNVNGSSGTLPSDEGFNDGFKIAGMNTGDSFVIKSDSANKNNTAIGILRSKIANRHYYEVSFHTSIDTGLIDYIYIKH